MQVLLKNLMERLESSAVGDRGEALGQLTRMGPFAAPAAPRIIQFLGDPDATLREQALEALKWIAPPDRPDILGKLVPSDRQALEAARQKESAGRSKQP